MTTNSHMKKIVLLSPPVFFPSEPYLALPSLKAFLSQFGYKVMIKDVNLEAFDTMLSSAYLSKCCIGIEQKIRAFQSKASLDESEREALIFLKKTLRFAPQVIKQIDSAKNNLKAQESRTVIVRSSLPPLKKLWSIIVVNSALDIINARYYPTKLSFLNLKINYSFCSSSDILQAVKDREQNLFIDFFERHIIPEVIANNPLLVGISINDQEQIIPGLTLAYLIKRKKIYVTIGGAIFTKELQIRDELFELCDSFIRNEGEHALLSLIQQLEGNGKFHEVPNLIWKNNTEKKVIFNELTYCEDLNVLPAPDFTGLSFDSYFTFFAQEIRLPLSIGKGCYWKKCAFCDITHEMVYKERDNNRTVEDLLSYIKKYNTRSIFIASPSVRLKTLEALCRAIIHNKLCLSWEAYARFDAALTPELCRLFKEAGCTKLYMGLESGVQRILDLLEKGTNLVTVRQVIKNLYHAGIAINIFVMVGTPTETEEDAAKTMEFILDNREMLDLPHFFLMIGTFYCSRHSKIFNDPYSYCVQKIQIDNPRDDLETRRKHVVIAPHSISLKKKRKVVSAFYDLAKRNFYYFGLAHIVWEETLPQGNLYYKFFVLLAKLIKHAVLILFKIKGGRLLGKIARISHMYRCN